MMQLPSLRRAVLYMERKRQDAQLHAAVYKEEKEEIEKRAKLAGKSISAFIRDACLCESSVQSSAIPIPIEGSPPSDPPKDTKKKGIEENFREREVPETGRKFSLEEEVCRRTGHELACDCFACERLRTLLK